MTSDIVIVGGGPNGLMLACELRLAGVHPVVLERLPERGGTTRAQALVGRIVQLFDYRGLPGAVDGTWPEPVAPPFYRFGGLMVDLRQLDPNPLDTLGIPQPQLEHLLEERARALGAEIRRGHEVTGLSQTDDRVALDVRGPDGTYRLDARYVAGCDGASSTVRKLAGIGFPDTGEQDVVARAADVVLPPGVLGGSTGSDGLLQAGSWLDLPGVGRVPFGITRTDTGVFAIGSFEPGIHILGTTEWGDTSADPRTPVTVDEVRASVRRVLGADLPMTTPRTPGPHRLFRTSGNSRQADRYRSGRVVLVGDAAHVHAAVGGPGLNLGLQDAVNVGWKLAGCVQGWAPEGLLDTYHSERHPVGERVLMQTQAQTALLAPGTDVTALRAVFAELVENTDNVRHLAELMAGSDVHYGTADPADGTPHPLLGRWAPDLTLATTAGATRVAELMRAGRPVLLDLTEESAAAGAALGWKDRVDLVTARGTGPVPAPATALLIRPDGYVAWASTAQTPGEADLGGLRGALSRWFGPMG